MKAADYIKDSRQKKVEMARVEAEVRIKQAHLESAKELESQAKTRFSNGLIGEEEYMVVKHAAARAELDIKRSRLNEAEVKISGETPRNELSAPLVGGRDFVSERLRIEQKGVELDIEHLGQRQERFQELVGKGLVQGVELEQIQAEMDARKATIEKTQERLALRKRFLAREITAREVEIQDRKAAVATNLKLARSKVDALKEQMKRLRMLESEGLISSAEGRELQFALTEAESELQLAALEMEVLGKIQ
jgi:outer membrane protein TolC